MTMSVLVNSKDQGLPWPWGKVAWELSSIWLNAHPFKTGTNRNSSGKTHRAPNRCWTGRAHGPAQVYVWEASASGESRHATGVRTPPGTTALGDPCWDRDTRNGASGNHEVQGSKHSVKGFAIGWQKNILLRAAENCYASITSVSLLPVPSPVKFWRTECNWWRKYRKLRLWRAEDRCLCAYLVVCVLLFPGT